MFGFLRDMFASRQTKNLEHLPLVTTKIEIYKTDWCPHCRTALMVLSKLNASNIHIYDIERERHRGHEMVKRTGRQTIPQVFIGDTHVGGASELIAAAKSGRLHSLLGLGVIEG